MEEYDPGNCDLRVVQYSVGIYRPCFGHEKAPIPERGSGSAILVRDVSIVPAFKDPVLGMKTSLKRSLSFQT
jgi:hypothetical protein